MLLPMREKTAKKQQHAVSAVLRTSQFVARNKSNHVITRVIMWTENMYEQTVFLDDFKMPLY